MNKKVVIGLSVFVLFLIVGLIVWRGRVIVDCFPYFGSIQEQQDREDLRFQLFSPEQKIRAKVFGTRCGSY